MRQWKAAGRADRDTEAELWKRFRGAQDKFFTARSEVFSAKDAELREHAEAKQELLDAAQNLLPVSDVRAARSALRLLQERWEQIGAVPRDAREHLESGLRRIEDAIRKAEETQWRRSNPEALARAEGAVAQLRATIAQLEKTLAQARDQGDTRAEHTAEEALTARRAWLEEAEHTLAEFKVLAVLAPGGRVSPGETTPRDPPILGGTIPPDPLGAPQGPAYPGFAGISSSCGRRRRRRRWRGRRAGRDRGAWDRPSRT